MFRLLTVTLVAITLVSGGAAQAKPAKPKTTTSEIRGSYVNDLSCPVPRYARPHADDPTKVDVSCDISSLYTGGLDGRTLGTATATVDLVTGDIVGEYDEWLYATYSAEDGSFGGIHFAGTWSIDGKTQAFTARSQIVGGTCSFAGAEGSGAFDGMSTHGGFIVELTRPNPTPAPAPTCNPIDPVPVPVP